MWFVTNYQQMRVFIQNEKPEIYHPNSNAYTVTQQKETISSFFIIFSLFSLFHFA